MVYEAPNPYSMSQKRFSVLAALIFLLVVLFVATSIVMLHHKDHSVSITGANAPEDSRPITRKMLRVVRMKAEEPKNSMRKDHRSEALPKGIVHRTSNIEMVPMVGDPERQDDAGSKPSKSLLAIPVGIKNKAAIDKLVSKFPATRFAPMLFHYDGAGEEQWGDLEWSARAVHISARGQTKWWFAKRFLHSDVVAEYDYIFVWDEDVEVDAFDPVRYLQIVKKEGLEILQPALDRRSEIHHGITARAVLGPGAAGGGVVHWRFYRLVADGGTGCDGSSEGPPCTGWVEVMVPVFSRAAWRCTWGMVQNDLVHAWGLDHKLGYCAQGDWTLKVGIVDSKYVLHRGVPTMGGTEGLAAAVRVTVRCRSYVEMQIFNRRWKDAAADASWTVPYQQGAADDH